MKRTTPPPDQLLLANARLVLPDRVTEPTSLLVAGDRIAAVGARRRRSARTATLDLSGLTLYPGFIDVHIHGAVGVDALAASTEDLFRVAQFLATRGVTAWLPTLVPAPEKDYWRAIHAIEGLIRWQYDDESVSSRSDRPAAARALGLHYEGPFVNAAQCGALRTEYFKTFDASAPTLEGIATIESFDVVHMMTVAPEVDGGIALVRRLVESGWIVSIGHTRAEAGVLDSARAAGARHMTHFFNAMSPLHHRDFGAVGWGLLRDDVTCDIIADGVHVHPEALRLALRCKTPARISLISDAVLPAGRGDGDYQVWGETISVVEGRTRNARGSIAGSVITMLDAARTMLSLGCAPHEVARMASLNPARLLGFDREQGSVEEAKRADLVALDGEGRARLTLVGGRVAFDALGDSLG